jgi:hypothetical protein
MEQKKMERAGSGSPRSPAAERAAEAAEAAEATPTPLDPRRSSPLGPGQWSGPRVSFARARAVCFCRIASP